ncbi:hypothetical protein LTR66_002060 [Elasticomyces elasticus]|nr:hypothetical protein LTR66_002060 [Elasticomyces elasticus]
MRPSRLQLALAIAVVRSKPLELDIRAYWHSEYERVHQTLNETQSRVSELERCNEKLVAQLQVTSATKGVKRSKGAAADVDGFTERSNKKVKVAFKAGTDGNISVTQETTRDLEEWLSVNYRDGQKVAQHLYALHTLFKSPSPDPSSLAFTLIEATTALSAAITISCRSVRLPTGSSNETISVKNLNPTYAPGPSEQYASLHSTFLASSRAVTSLLHGLERLVSTLEGSQLAGRVIYALVAFCGDILFLIAGTSELQAKQGITLLGIGPTDVTESHHTSATLVPASSSGSKAKPTKTSVTVRKQKCSKSRKRSLSPRRKATQQGQDLSVLSQLANFLVTLIDSLNPAIAAHRQLFEGFLFVLMQSLGKRLYLFSFGYERSATIEDEIADYTRREYGNGSETSAEGHDRVDDGRSDKDVRSSLRQPGDQTQETIEDADKRSLKLRAAKIEAPYLFSLFERAMAIAPAHLSPDSPTATAHNKASSPLKDNKHSKLKMPRRGTSKAIAPGSAPLAPVNKSTDRISKHLSTSRQTLTLPAKQRLQQTLVNAIYGAAEASDDEFTDCLRMPTCSGPGLQLPKVKDEDVAEWFKGELWRICGWEMLGKEEDW